LKAESFRPILRGLILEGGVVKLSVRENAADELAGSVREPDPMQTAQLFDIAGAKQRLAAMIFEKSQP
jgi:hypothetical protein